MDRTREDKRRELIGEHLPYEVTMLQNAYGFIAMKANEIAIKTNEINVCIESFAIHARSLLEFFEVIDPKGATASDFTAGKYDPIYVGKIKTDTIRKLHNQIAHLTIDRTKVQEDKLGGPERQEIIEAFTNEMVEFHKKLRPEYQALLIVQRTTVEG